MSVLFTGGSIFNGEPFETKVLQGLNGFTGDMFQSASALTGSIASFFENQVVLRVTCFSQFVCLCASITNLPKPKI